MTRDLLEFLTSNDNEVLKETWRLSSGELDLPKLLASVTRFQTQLEVQTVLLSSENQLWEYPANKSLPNLQANRVKNFLKFVFEKTTRDSARQARLRTLDCSSIKLCGLSYTVREIIELPRPLFDFLIENVPSFVEQKRLFLHLCRDDIHRAVLNDLDPDDDEAFTKFLNEHFELRLQHRRSLRSPVVDMTDEEENVSSRTQPKPLIISPNPRKRTKLDRTFNDNEEVNGRQIQYMYSNAPTGHIQKLGDLLSNAVHSSRQWKIERSHGETTTNCLTIMVPQNPTQDISITLWVGPEKGLELNTLFDLKPQWTSLPNHREP